MVNKVNEICIDDPNVIDTRNYIKRYPLGKDFKVKTPDKNGNFVYNHKATQDTIAHEEEQIDFENTRIKMYPAQELICDSAMCDIIITNESMDIFNLASDYLVDRDYFKSLHDKKFRKQDLPISSRVLNDWIYKRELLEDCRENTEQWHTFSQIDLAYVHILKACRDFGISVRKLQMARNSFYKKLLKIKFCLIDIAYAYFDFAKASGDIYLIMDIYGRCNIVRAIDLMHMAKAHRISNHFILNLSEVWNED
jgi:hypothetical protein